MATRRRRKNPAAARLKMLIGVLTVILAAMLIVAFTLPNRQEQDPSLNSSTPPQTQPSTLPSTAPSTTPSQTTQPTAPPPTGWVELDGKTYYYGDDSVLRTGAQEVDGSIYCFGTDGALLGEGWQDIGQERYYLQADGTAYTGWLELADNLYYLQADGTMARGQLEIEGETWFFTSAGCQIYVVNPWHKVPENYSVTLVKLPDSHGSNRYVADFMYDPLMQMIHDCEAAMREKFAGTGKTIPTLWVRSANRTHSDQAYLFENKVQRVLAENPGYTRAQAEAKAATTVALPGTSEHQLALAVDIVDARLNSLVEEQENMEAQQWLMEHCHEYGFILRYPKNTTDETGIIYEPWHYRYVGKALAQELHDLDMTLEAYIASLS